MTDDVRGEFEEFPVIEVSYRDPKYFWFSITQNNRVSKKLFWKLFPEAINEAYAKGRQSVLDKIPNEQLVDTEILKILKLDFTHTYSLKVFYKWLISKLSDDKGG